MAESSEKKSAGEKRGPVEKTEKGWPINPVGVVALVVFAIVIIFLIVRPLLNRAGPQVINVTEQQTAEGGQITSPKAGEIITGSTLNIKLSIDEPTKAQKIQYWAKTYADGKWQMIGEITQSPYDLTWQIPASFQNKAVAITSHIYQTDGNVIKDPGGWREGIIILAD